MIPSYRYMGICKRGGDTGLVVVIGNTGQDGDQDVGGEDHHGALSQTQECLHPRQRRELDTLICGRVRRREGHVSWKGGTGNKVQHGVYTYTYISSNTQRHVHWTKILECVGSNPI